MGSIVCQSCNQVIDYYEAEKVHVLYGTCCEECGESKKEETLEL
ncbi:GapA-binding peptide SR1P [Evansella sp. LMS18]|nr:GapA-binding peptide SR1P [Evansella sp. LMS18]UTR11021.1 GapA-binding peptide SR1P [Evansella sp. LMS18]